MYTLQRTLPPKTQQGWTLSFGLCVPFMEALCKVSQWHYYVSVTCMQLWETKLRHNIILYWCAIITCTQRHACLHWGASRLTFEICGATWAHMALGNWSTLFCSDVKLCLGHCLQHWTVISDTMYYLLFTYIAAKVCSALWTVYCNSRYHCGFWTVYSAITKSLDHYCWQSFLLWCLL